ncbi:MAG: (Fe-S)-binding protein, partial [Pseudomonadota bacterium]
YNSGDFKGAGAIVQSLPKAFAKADYIVVPSGSCAAMLRTHLPQLVDANETGSGQAGLDFAGKSWELAAFLVEVMQFSLPDRTSPALPLNYTYHDSCSGLRELKIKSAPRNLLDQIKGCTRHEMEQAEICCGFGGTFCVKYPELSEHMLDRKLESIAQTKANTVLAGDLGCLMNMAGRARRIGLQLEFRHYAEILADLADIPAIGAAQ